MRPWKQSFIEGVPSTLAHFKGERDSAVSKAFAVETDISTYELATYLERDQTRTRRLNHSLRSPILRDLNSY